MTDDGRTSIDATGLIVCPGFVDAHTHSDITILVEPKAESAVRQGVTTQVFPNCGMGLAPAVGEALTDIEERIARFGIEVDWKTVGEYFQRVQAMKPSINIVPMVAQGTVRMAVMGYSERTADAGAARGDEGARRRGDAKRRTGNVLRPEVRSERLRRHEVSWSSLRRLWEVRRALCKPHEERGRQRRLVRCHRGSAGDRARRERAGADLTSEGTWSRRLGEELASSLGDRGRQGDRASM